MKILQLIQHDFRVLGVGTLHQSIAQNYTVNKKFVHKFFILCLDIGSCCVYFCIDANSFQEYSMSVYVSTTFMLGAVAYAICVWKNQPIFETIDKAEKTIDESEFNIFKSINHFKPNLLLS